MSSTTLRTDVKRLLAQCYADRRVAGQLLFPERFSRPFDKVHTQLFDAIMSDHQLIAIAAPRGMGKTSIANFLFPATEILFAERDYIIPVSATTDLAQQQSESLKAGLMHTELIQKIFGDISTSNFSQHQWVVNVANKDICVMPRGNGQQVRGLLFRGKRPDLILVDDLEDSDNVMSEVQRRKLERWFFGDLLNCVDRGSDDWKVIVVGTILHENSLLQTLLDDPEWYSVRLEICDDDLNSNAPNFMSTAKVKALYQQFKSRGEVDTFYREYRNMPSAGGEDAAFQTRYFRYYDEKDVDLSNDPNVSNVVILDPARTVKADSAESGIVGVAFNPRTSAIFVRDAIGEKLHPDELYDRAAEQVIRFNADAVAVEVTGLHEFVLHPLKDALARHGLGHIPVIPLTARGGANEKGKTARVRSLVPYYRSGLIYHNSTACQKLEGQLLAFPASALWDLMDPLGYIVEIMEKHEQYMLPETFLGQSRSEVEKELREAQAWAEEEAPLGNWRAI